jgi:hypothetical protein
MSKVKVEREQRNCNLEAWEDETDMEECIVTAFINGFSSLEAEQCRGNELCTNPKCCFIPDEEDEFYLV